MKLNLLREMSLGSEKKSKNNEKTPVWGFVEKPLAFERRIHTSFQTILVLGIFWRLPLIFGH